MNLVNVIHPIDMNCSGRRARVCVRTTAHKQADRSLWRGLDGSWRLLAAAVYRRQKKQPPIQIAEFTETPPNNEWKDGRKLWILKAVPILVECLVFKHRCNQVKGATQTLYKLV